MLVSKIIKKLILLSRRAYKHGEIPVAAIVVQNQKVILSEKYNLRENRKDVTAHAEILAIRKAAHKLKRWNLSDCELYVTLKPCKMCEEVIKQSRLKNVYYLLDKLDYKRDFSKTNFEHLIISEEKDTYQQLLSDFFQNMR